MSGSLGTPGFDQDDRLIQGDLARRGKERTRIPDGFHVKDNTAGARVITEIIDQVAPPHIQHRADRKEGAEAHHFTKAPIEDGGAERATLTDEGHVSRARDRIRKSCVQSGKWAHNAQAVWSNDAHAPAPRLFQNLLL